MTTVTEISPQDEIGPEGQYRLIERHASLDEGWRADGPQGRCYLRAHTPLGWETLSSERRSREERAVIRELNRWRGLTVARPSFREIFWENQRLFWVEAPISGAPLSSLSAPLSLYEGMSLIEECLCALDLIHAERDFQLGEPLLHLNITPDTIWRGSKGSLYLMHPLSPTLIELNGKRTLSDDEALSGRVAPELLRGRYGMSSDLYGLGMSALSAMTGMSIERVDERLQSERLFVHDLSAPEPIISFLTQLTAFRASARFQSAREALSAFATLPQLTPPPPPEIQEEQTLQPTENETPSLSQSDPQTQLSLIHDDGEQEGDPLSFYTLAHERKVGSEAALLLKEHDVDGDVIVDVVVKSQWGIQGWMLVPAVALLVIIWIVLQPEQTPPITESSPDPKRPESSLSSHSTQEDKPTPSPAPSRAVDSYTTTSSRPTLQGAPRPEWIALPAGRVNVGSPPDEGYENERPLRVVSVSPFKVSKTEVTVLQYAQCVAQGVCSTDGLKKPDWGDERLCNWDRVGRSLHPINCISWYQAQTYAQWVGGRLLSEAEWSYMAQSASKQRQIYPWGSEPASCERAVIADPLRGSGCGTEHTSRVCTKPLGQTKQGVCDVVGNVWEWVQDEWHADYHGAPDSSSPWVDQDPLTWQSSERVYRGGGAYDELDLPRIARRGHRSPQSRQINLGFRIAHAVQSSPSKRQDDTLERSIKTLSD